MQLPNNSFNPAAILSSAVDSTYNATQTIKTATNIASRFGFRYAAAASVAAVDSTYNAGWQVRQWWHDHPATVQLWRDRAVNGAVILAALSAIAFMYASIAAFRAGQLARTAWERFKGVFDLHSTTWFNSATAAQFVGSIWEQESVPMPIRVEGVAVILPQVCESRDSVDIETMADRLEATRSIRQLKAMASAQKIAGFGKMNKSDLAMALAARCHNA